MCYHLARLHLGELSSPSRLLSDGDKMLALARSSSFSSAISLRKASFLETYVGVATLVILRALQTSNAEDSLNVANDGWRSAARLLKDVINAIARDDQQRKDTDSSHDGDSEVLYGRAGFLYALLLLRSARNTLESHSVSEIISAVDELISDASIEKVVESIIRRGSIGAGLHNRELTESEFRPALMWTWYGKRYLGAAHGIGTSLDLCTILTHSFPRLVAGILHILLLCPPTIVAPHMSAILQTIEWLISLQDASGNWPSSARQSSRRASEENELVQYVSAPPVSFSTRLTRYRCLPINSSSWCHGAPGTIILLSTLLRRAPSIEGSAQLSHTLRDKIVASLHRGAALVHTRGFLRKGVGLCHGVAGSVFALLTASDALSADPTQSAVYFQQAVHLAHLATKYAELTRSGEMRTPDSKWSLYEGTAGMCCAWGEIAQRMGDCGTSGACERRIGCGMPAFDDLQVEG